MSPQDCDDSEAERFKARGVATGKVTRACAGAAQQSRWAGVKHARRDVLPTACGDADRAGGAEGKAGGAEGKAGGA